MDNLTFGKNNPDREGIRWTALALATEASRYHLNVMQVKGNHIIATDGHRLHAYRLATKVEAGCYTLAKSKSDLVLVKSDVDAKDYPEWLQVIPKHKPEKVFVVHIVDRNGLGLTSIATSVYRAMKHNTININFLKDIATVETWFKVRIKDKKCESAVVFRNHKYFAAVMPMRE